MVFAAFHTNERVKLYIVHTSLRFPCYLRHSKFKVLAMFFSYSLLCWFLSFKISLVACQIIYSILLQPFLFRVQSLFIYNCNVWQLLFVWLADIFPVYFPLGCFVRSEFLWSFFVLFWVISNPLCAYLMQFQYKFQFNFNYWPNDSNHKAFTDTYIHGGCSAVRQFY